MQKIKLCSGIDQVVDEERKSAIEWHKITSVSNKKAFCLEFREKTF